jgi:hypothetical protein
MWFKVLKLTKPRRTGGVSCSRTSMSPPNLAVPLALGRIVYEYGHSVEVGSVKSEKKYRSGAQECSSDVHSCPGSRVRRITPKQLFGSSAGNQVRRPPSHTDDETGNEAGVESILAIITQSGSTNSRGYKVVIHNDGSATAEIGGTSFAFRTEPSRSQEFPPGTIDTKTLRRLLTQIGDVSRIPIGSCAKSVSFGTRTQITYASKTSGDLQCIRQQASDGDRAPLQASEDLGRFVQTTLGQLKINDRRIGSNQ